MNSGVLAIYDLDESYANSLMKYICDKEGMPFRTIAFTEKEALLHYVEENHIDLLLISSNAMEECFTEKDIGKIILLSPGDIFSEYIGFSSIYKFQSSENIIREVLDYYVDVYQKSGSVPVNLGRTEVIGVYSPVGRVGKTTFALTLGQILSTEHTTLYINLEEFSAFEEFMEKKFPSDLSDLLYYYKQYPESLHIKLKAVVENYNGLDYIPPLTFSEDLRQMKGKEWIAFVEQIISFGIYDRVILDLSNMLEDPLNLLEHCDRIYMPVANSGMSSMKIQAFETFLRKNDKEALARRIEKVPMPDLYSGKTGTAYLEEQLWGTLGDMIRQMLEGGGDAA